MSSCCQSRENLQATIQRVSPTMSTRPWYVSLPSRDVVFLWMTAHVQSNYTKECANSTKKFNTETSTNCQKNGFNKTGTRKRSQDRPLPWVEKQYQVVNAEFRFMRHPRADADPQKFDKSSKVTTKQRNTMRTIATRAHAEEHVERKCEAKNCAL